MHDLKNFFNIIRKMIFLFFKNIIVYIALVCVIIMWSLSYVGIKDTLKYFHPESIGFLRFFFASLFIFPWYFFLIPKKYILQQYDIFLLLITGSIGIGMYTILINLGEKTVDPTITSFIISLIPVFVSIITFFFLNEKINTMGWIGIVISLVGIAMIFIQSKSINYGIIYLCLSALCGAFYTIMQKPLLKKLSPLEITSWCIWFATIAMSFSAPIAIKEIYYAPRKEIISIILLGIGPGALAYTLWSFCLNHLQRRVVANSLYFVPFLSIIFEWIFLKKIPSWKNLLGGIIILFGVIVIFYKNKNK